MDESTLLTCPETERLAQWIVAHLQIFCQNNDIHGVTFGHSKSIHPWWTVHVTGDQTHVHLLKSVALAYDHGYQQGAADNG